MTDLSPTHANTILRFLERVQISGQEAPAFMECVLLLQMIASVNDAVSGDTLDTSIPDLTSQVNGQAKPRPAKRGAQSSQ